MYDWFYVLQSSGKCSSFENDESLIIYLWYELNVYFVVLGVQNEMDTQRSTQKLIYKNNN